MPSLCLWKMIYPGFETKNLRSGWASSVFTVMLAKSEHPGNFVGLWRAYLVRSFLCPTIMLSSYLILRPYVTSDSSFCSRVFSIPSALVANIVVCRDVSAQPLSWVVSSPAWGTELMRPVSSDPSSVTLQAADCLCWYHA